MNKTAFNNPSGSLFKLDSEIIRLGIAASLESERKRIILPIHRKQEAEVQRMLNFLQPGTYIHPHRHPMPNATESVVLLQGAIRFFTFDDTGNLLTDQLISATPIPGVIDIEPNVWHTFIVLKPVTILFECKKGPYNAETDKEFAGWAPEENSAGAASWMKKLVEQ